MRPNSLDGWGDADDADDADALDALDALDFGTPALEADIGLDALPDYGSDTDENDGVGIDGIDDYVNPEVAHTDDVADDFGLDAENDANDEHEVQTHLVQAVNPPGTVAVTAYLNGSVSQIHLDPRVTTLTEGQLADEIRFVAAVAAAKATAVVHAGVVDMMVEQGVDPKEARNFVATNMPFATPQQASDAELALIARHSSEEH